MAYSNGSENARLHSIQSTVLLLSDGKMCCGGQIYDTKIAVIRALLAECGAHEMVTCGIYVVISHSSILCNCFLLEENTLPSKKCNAGELLLISAHRGKGGGGCLVVDDQVLPRCLGRPS